MKNRVKGLFVLAVGFAMTLVSCNKEPDESDLYTFTGQTIEDYLQANDSIFHLFNIIMERSQYSNMMSTYGEYTCYAPMDDGMAKYIDQLYNDSTSEDHNGMTENSVYGLTDKQCKEIARFHLSPLSVSYVDQLCKGNEQTIITMLNTPFISKLGDDGIVRFNDDAAVLSYDHEMENGIVHIIDKPISRNTNLAAKVLKNMPEFSIFYEALHATGLDSTILALYEKEGTYSLSENKGRPGSSFADILYYYPTECKIRYTIFAETDDVFRQNDITDFESLKAKCAEWYSGAAAWYDYPDKSSNPISTGDDYTYTYNVVNMFIRYHILRAGMTVSHLVYEDNGNNVNWNYAFGGEPYDYYETLLPHTLMKIWQPLYASDNTNSKNIFINRYIENNTLTDQIGLYGSAGIHTVKDKGVLVNRAKSNIQALNAYIHAIDKPLVYSRDVPNGVLHERMRIDAVTMFPELINNDFRFATPEEIGAMNPYSNDGGQVRLPLDYFDDLVCYKQNTKLSFYVQGAWRAWESNQISGWDENDFAFRLPPVPSGDYEIRIVYPPTKFGGIQQYYIGTTKETGSMQPLGIPFDARYPNTSLEADRTATGYLLYTEFSDYGVASDLVMRNHGYMRAPASFSRGTFNSIKTPITDPADLIGTDGSNIPYCSRYEEGYGTSLLRRILGTVHLDQDKDYWLRIKNLLTNYPELGFSVDFIELVPVDIVNSQDYTEDWY